MRQERIGVVLFQLGGPDTLESIEPFLYNLFCDPDIINFPFARIGRKPLAKLISTTRAKKVEHHYAVIGGGSPIRKFTELQGLALQRELRSAGMDAHCVVAMRYWHPFTHEAVEQLESLGCDQVVLLPLYPQYSSTTTGSSLNEWRRCWDETPVARHVRQHVVRNFYRDPMYLQSLVENVGEALARFDDPAAPELVFSAHGVPMSVIENGDPYQQQVEETVELLMECGGWHNPHRVCYQSKVGASKWLRPSLRTTIRELAAAGGKQVCVVPISFVSDHVETLGEIDHEARALAAQLGIRRFVMTEGLNDSATFIAALAGLVTRAAGLESQDESVREMAMAD
jgi:protoporphyrin/coproporphyrin ferrochelatase